jgi:hypothetical protein
MVLCGRSTIPLVCGDLAFAGMVEVFHGQMQLIFVMLGVAAVFGAAVRQHAQHPDAFTK